MQKLAFWIILSSMYLTAWLDDVIAVEGKSFANVNRTVKLSLANRKNQTGHSVTHLSVDKSSMELPDNWNIDIENQFTEYNGKRAVHLLAVITVPPPVPVDYELFPGIGYYKFHSDLAPNFDAASAVCLKEGGHLVIINSLAESSVMEQLWKPYTQDQNFKQIYAYAGVHDRLKEGEFVTIFGQPIHSTGFAKWAGSGPDNWNNNEDCGSVTIEGLLNDVHCGSSLPFICEYDLSWNQ